MPPYMGRRRMEEARKVESAGGNNCWMITYTDMCILLVSFFVLLVSMSTVDRNRQQKAIDSVDRAIGFLEKGAALVGENVEEQRRGTLTGGVEGDVADAETLQVFAAQQHLEEDVHVAAESGKTVIRIDQRALFLPGEWSLTPQLQTYLALLADHLKRGNDAIEIRGHTDPGEDIGNPSWTHRSWELSTRRAMTVYDFLRAQGISVNRMSARGFSYHKPLFDGFESPELRERNRRVEILLGPDESIPASLTGGEPRPSQYFNYKKFFFRLFPSRSGSEVEPHGPSGG